MDKVAKNAPTYIFLNVRRSLQYTWKTFQLSTPSLPLSSPACLIDKVLPFCYWEINCHESRWDGSGSLPLCNCCLLRLHCVGLNELWLQDHMIRLFQRLNVTAAEQGPKWDQNRGGNCPRSRTAVRKTRRKFGLSTSAAVTLLLLLLLLFSLALSFSNFCLVTLPLSPSSSLSLRSGKTCRMPGSVPVPATSPPSPTSSRSEPPLIQQQAHKSSVMRL